VSGVLVYSENESHVHPLASWAADHADMLGPVSVAVLGKDAGNHAEQYRGSGASRVFVTEAPGLEGLAEDVVSSALAQIAKQADADLILLSATRRGRSLASRLAQELDAGCVSEAIEVGIEDGRLITGRYALGGNTVSREVILTPLKVVAVTTGTVEGSGSAAAEGEIIIAELSLPEPRMMIIERNPKPASTVNIAESDRLVCVGRGLAQQDDLKMIEDLAAELAGEVACTRPLSSEYGWVSEERMIGISGEKCNPQLILSLGVSGQVQHTVGIMGAKTIVAVNSDPNAPIFKLADYGIVGDLYEVVPALADALKLRGAN
jgi:electron transfer flavoprotein alpha subunit